jgi:hypothetical protein
MRWTRRRHSAGEAEALVQGKQLLNVGVERGRIRFHQRSVVSPGGFRCWTMFEALCAGRQI